MDDALNYLSIVPDEIIFDLALDTPLNDIYNLCQLESRFNSILCNNEGFWRSKFIHDFGFAPNV